MRKIEENCREFYTFSLKSAKNKKKLKSVNFGKRLHLNGFKGNFKFSTIISIIIY